MSNLQTILDASVAEGDLPFVVAMVTDGTNTRFSGAAGDAAPGRKAAEDTLFRIFSMTKSVGSTAAMIQFDRGKLDPDTPVDEIVPEFAELKVLDGYDGDVPRFRAPRTRATLRHLATHTAGLEYEFWNQDVATYMEKTGHPSILSGLKASMSYPLMTDPGTRWGYGPNIDWLGLAVERTDGRRIDRFCQEEIFEPLGMSDTSFEVPADKADRLSAIGIRGADGQFAPIDIAPPPSPEVYGMGHALYSTAPDYIRYLRMLLGRGASDGRRILSEKAIDLMFADQMRGLKFERMVASSPLTADFDPFPDLELTHSFGFMRNEQAVPGGRSAGSLAWAGVLNSHYWLDPSKGIAAVFMTQSLPFVEPPYIRRYGEFERAVYADLQ